MCGGRELDLSLKTSPAARKVKIYPFLFRFKRFSFYFLFQNMPSMMNILCLGLFIASVYSAKKPPAAGCFFDAAQSTLELRQSSLRCPNTQRVILAYPPESNLPGFYLSRESELKNLGKKINCDHSYELSEIININQGYWAFIQNVVVGNKNGALLRQAKLQSFVSIKPLVCKDFQYDSATAMSSIGDSIDDIDRMTSLGNKIFAILNSKHYNLIWTDSKANSLKGKIVPKEDNMPETPAISMAALAILRNSKQYRLKTAYAIQDVISEYFLLLRQRDPNGNEPTTIIIEQALSEWADVLVERAITNLLGSSDITKFPRYARVEKYKPNLALNALTEKSSRGFNLGFIERIQQIINSVRAQDRIINKDEKTWGFKTLKVSIERTTNPDMKRKLQQQLTTLLDLSENNKLSEGATFSGPLATAKGLQVYNSFLDLGYMYIEAEGKAFDLKWRPRSRTKTADHILGMPDRETKSLPKSIPNSPLSGGRRQRIQTGQLAF